MRLRLDRIATSSGTSRMLLPPFPELTSGSRAQIPIDLNEQESMCAGIWASAIGLGLPFCSQ